MRRSVLALGVFALLMSMLAMPAAASTLDELEEAVRLAEQRVLYWEGEVDRLEGEIEEKEDEVDAQQGVVDDLKDDLTVAEGNLKVAEDRLAELVAERAECDKLATPPLRNACRNPTNPEYNNLNDNVVPALSEIVAGIAEDLIEAEGVLEDLEEDLRRLNEAKELADAELAAARIALELAQAELDAYNPEAPHPGCKGVNNAQEQVEKKVPVKGKAPAALAAVAEKLGC
jgi:chromosome segregation ATPase